MSTHAPEMPILVDDETGVWTTDALPMLYVPRHFFVNNHMGIEEVLGADKYAYFTTDGPAVQAAQLTEAADSALE